MQHWSSENIPDQTGRTFVVTGANSGLGYVTTRELARHGGHVIMAVRDESKGRRAMETLRAGQPDASLELRLLDLSDLDSVRAFADGVVQAPGKVDVLVNNAGVMMGPRTLTKQGFERQFGTNHLGHFALTGLLMSALKTGTDPRVVTISSSMHKRGSIDFDDLDLERRYSPAAAYSRSKFANVLFGLELDRRLRAAGLAMLSVLAHPGYAATNLQIAATSGLARLGMRISNRLIAQSVDQGALNQLYAATDAQVQSGQFIGPDGVGEMRGYPTQVQPIEAAKDAHAARRLWEISEERTGVSFHLAAAAS
jgi:NAD(P)-dependent dehydrogenase (short-subunit alcohol dehydrogenase family)